MNIYRSCNFVFRLAFMALFLSFEADVQAINEGFKSLSNNQVVQIGDEYFKVVASIDIPTKYPALYNRIRQDMFGDATIDYMEGVNAFVKSIGGKKVKSSSNIAGILPFKGYCHEFYEKKYFTYEITYTTISEGELTGIKKNFIYSLVDDKILDSQNIFAPTANIKSVKALNVDNSSNDIRNNNLVITSFDDDLVTTITLAHNEALFSDMFLKLLDWQKINDVYDLGKSEEGTKAVEKYLAYRGNNSVTSHVYTLNNDYYVSRLNKNIIELSEAEINKLSKDVQRDVEKLKEIIAETPEKPVICHNPDKQAEFIFKGEDDFYGYVIKKMNNNSKALNILNNNRGTNVELYIQFVVEPDGTTSALVVRKISSQSALLFVEPLFKQIRNSDKWQPATKDGKPVRSIIVYRFNLVGKKRT